MVLPIVFHDMFTNSRWVILYCIALPALAAFRFQRRDL
jgi:hypothetical protein